MALKKSDDECVCDVCGKQFSRLQYLKQHLNIHSDEKPFRCEICDKRFLYHQSYKEHQQRHDRNKTVQCELCGKRFYNKRELQGHKKVHDQKGKFHCELCDLFFLKETSLQAHCNRLHAALYICKFCQETFSDKKLFKKHEFRQHRKERKQEVDLVRAVKMVCSLCGKVLCNKWRLESHLICKHKMDKRSIVEKGLLKFKGRDCEEKSFENESKILFGSANREVLSKRNTSNKASHAPILDSVKEKKCDSRKTKTIKCAPKAGEKRPQNVVLDKHLERTHLNTVESDQISSQSFSVFRDNKSTLFSEELVLNQECDDRVFNKALINSSDCGNSNTDKVYSEGPLAIGCVSENSANLVRTENPIESTPHSTCLFSNEDTDSNNTCAVDFKSETDSFVDDVTNEYEVLQHEFDEIPDTTDSDEEIQTDSSITVRPSSLALQEYFAQYSRKLNKRSEVTTGSLKRSTSTLTAGVQEPYTTSFAETGIRTREELQHSDPREFQALKLSNIRFIDSDSFNFTSAGLEQRSFDTVSESNVNSETHFKYPMSPKPLLEKRKQSGQNSDQSSLVVSKPDHASPVNISFPKRQGRIKIFVKHADKGRWTIGQTEKRIPVQDSHDKMDRNSVCGYKMKSDAGLREVKRQKLPLIFRIGKKSNDIPNNQISSADFTTP